ncbi:DUF4097 family beta strand repeat-containing protein [Emticicia sp. BO119]|uniref:DUF4097 family beta strand repeat-containing protein n=1 Tax=Emticicia sp. BO119 TaxID=2757768 RepID=UPI0015EFEBFC|nr:DUF4097 family beta strand repeat-containing protein [Emticicia sp. BO119]MBA4853124.1 DUF4097 family beta strand repeat protein [Emticicia sp. BO119]
MKKIRTYIHLLKPLLIGLFLLQQAKAQTTLQVVTKSIEKTFSITPNLVVEAEKADIELITWEKDKIQARIELIAKHPDRNVAKNDLEMLKYIADKMSDKILLRNYLVVQSNAQKPGSNFKTKYTIYLPENLKVTIQNSFGKIFIQGKYSQLTIKSEFCVLDLQKAEGIAKMETYYGVVHSKNFSGVSMIKSERSELFFQQLSGINIINAQYGKIEIESVVNLKSLTINAKKTEINLKIPLQNHGFNLETRYGKMFLPDGFKWVQNTDNTKAATYNLSAISKISIQNSFGNISIN